MAAAIATGSAAAGNVGSSATGSGAGGLGGGGRRFAQSFGFQEQIERFAELGFPTTHDEEWRFTNVAAIARAAFTPTLRDLAEIGTLAAECLARAIARGVYEATPLPFAGAMASWKGKWGVGSRE